MQFNLSEIFYYEDILKASKTYCISLVIFYRFNNNKLISGTVKYLKVFLLGIFK